MIPSLVLSLVALEFQSELPEKAVILGVGKEKSEEILYNLHKKIMQFQKTARF